MKTFMNENFEEIRMVRRNGELWFNAEDVADILGYSDMDTALDLFVAQEDMMYDHDTSTVMVNAAGLFELISGDKTVSSEQCENYENLFKGQVTSKILPGVYAKEYSQRVDVLEQQLAEMQAKEDYYDVILRCKDLVPISKIAEDYGWSVKRMNEYLYSKRIQRVKDDDWFLYKEYARRGYTRTRIRAYRSEDGRIRTKPLMYWTQKGRLWLYEILKADGYLPMIEWKETDNARKIHESMPAKRYMALSDVAKMYGVSEEEFMCVLKERQILKEVDNGYILNADYLPGGAAVSVEGPDCYLWTETGVDFLGELLREEGYFA